MMKQVNIKMPFRLLVLVLGLFLSVGAFAQIDVKGHVKDAQGEPIIGATVRVANTQTATVTDFDGNFMLKANPGADLQISYIGYQTATVKAAASVEVTMQDDATMLENVVVIGYGVARKTDLTGSVVAMKPDEKNHGMITSAQDMIAGKIAGVNVNSATGAPGDGAQIRIRGGASLNASNNPLIVIDGMAMDGYGTQGTNNPLALVNPNDIESFTVLKDASATAIYGSRGSNGVIIITTKKGRRNQKPQITYNGNISVSTIAKKLDVMNASDYRAYIRNTYGENSSEYQGLGNADTDWQKEIYHPAVSFEHNVSVMGGVGGKSWTMPYRASVGYTDQDGILRGSDYRRFTAGFTLNPSLFDDHLNMNINGKYAYSITSEGGRDAIGAATSMDPTRPVFSEDPRYQNWGGYWQWTTATSAYDPTFPYDRNSKAPMNPRERVDHYDNDKSAHVLLGNFEADYKIHGFEDLRLHMNLAGEYDYGGNYTYNNRYSTYGYYFGGEGEDTAKKYNLIATAYAQYFKDFNKDHHFDIMGGYEYSRTKYWGDNWYKDYYPMTYQGVDDDGNALAGTPHSNDAPKSWAKQNVLVSWYGRANYTLLDRYLFTFTARYDGSSRFADGHRWGFFPSAAFAWRINDEPFMRNAKNISEMKLRLGWGKTGQQDTGKEYYTPVYAVSTSDYYRYPVGPNTSGLLYKPQVYNNELTWETTTTYNVGLDLGFFNQRLTFNVDAYYRKTTDLLCTPQIPGGMNFDNSMMLNAGSLENKGVEVAITGKPVQTDDWFIELGVNAAYNKNKITELYGGRDMIEADMVVGTDSRATYHKVGEPASSFWVYQQVYDQAGRPIQGQYVDRNADGIIDENDRYFYKSIHAPLTGGFSFKVSYKDWDLGTNFRASFGNYVYNDIIQGKMNSKVLVNPDGYYSNSTADIVALRWNSYNYPLSDYFVQNASFLKCDNITIGWNFKTIDDYLKGRIYASCTNVFTITKYKGLDPEQTSGKESSVYPRSRTFLVGLNLTF